jgi:hypothetical protein
VRYIKNGNKSERTEDGEKKTLFFFAKVKTNTQIGTVAL